MPKTFCVYIMASRSLNFYVDLTSNLRKRVWQHKIGYFEDSHTSRYRITRLLHCEQIEEFANAVAREKQLKPWSREKKLRLVRKNNPGLKDLAKDWFTAEQLERAPLDLKTYATPRRNAGPSTPRARPRSTRDDS